jgi:glycine dehydrogenase subunit 2
MKLLFEKSVPGRRGVCPGPSDVPTTINNNDDLLRHRSAALPEMSELDVVRHFTEQSRRNFGVDTNFYPLGSCTMKYNPKVAERIATYPGFAHLHPLLPQLRMGGMLTQGALAILHEMDLLLREITGMAGFTMQPMAGRARRADRHDDHGRLPSRQRQQEDRPAGARQRATAPTPPAPPSRATASSRSRATPTA